MSDAAPPTQGFVVPGPPTPTPAPPSPVEDRIARFKRLYGEAFVALSQDDRPLCYVAQVPKTREPWFAGVDPQSKRPLAFLDALFGHAPERPAPSSSPAAPPPMAGMPPGVSPSPYTAAPSQQQQQSVASTPPVDSSVMTPFALQGEPEYLVCAKCHHRGRTSAWKFVGGCCPLCRHRQALQPETGAAPMGMMAGSPSPAMANPYQVPPAANPYQTQQFPIGQPIPGVGGITGGGAGFAPPQPFAPPPPQRFEPPQPPVPPFMQPPMGAPPPQPFPAPQPPPQPQGVTCASCGTVASVAAWQSAKGCCPRCGTVPSMPQPREAQARIPCPACKVPNPPGVRRCISCLSPWPQPEDARAEEPTTCPACGHVAARRAWLQTGQCPRCGDKLIKKRPVNARYDVNAPKVTCTACGKPTPSDSPECLCCGAMRGVEENPEVQCLSCGGSARRSAWKVTGTCPLCQRPTPASSLSSATAGGGGGGGGEEEKIVECDGCAKDILAEDGAPMVKCPECGVVTSVAWDD